MRTIAVMNQKGGVGKTTTVAQLAYALVRRGSRVVAIDFDPQGDLSRSMGQDPSGLDGIAEVLQGDCGLADCVVDVCADLQLVPCGAGLRYLEAGLPRTTDSGVLLQNALRALPEDIDFTLIDCPPASPLLLVNALFAAQELIVPVASDYLSLCGLLQLVGTVRHFEAAFRRRLELKALRTRYDRRRRLAREVASSLAMPDGLPLFEVAIREAAALAECPSHGMSIFEYAARSNGAADYDALAAEVCGAALRQFEEAVHAN